MLILCSMHTNCELQDALFKNLVALNVLVWSRGRLVTLQILTRFSHGSLGQCVSFSLIDVGSGSTAYIVFFPHSLPSLDSEKEHAPHFEQQHRDTCHSGHFHRARWRTPLREYVISQAKPAHIPHNMLREVKVRIARRHQGGTPIPQPSA